MNENIFEAQGGQYITAANLFKRKLNNIKALLFDWDGVFNSGAKGEIPSNFNEADSMGMNMLRFGYFLLSGKIPYTAIVTGETNQTAFKWAKRERFDDVYFQVKNKIELLPGLKSTHGIEPDQVLFVFDDILDLSLAREVGARFLVNRQANPLFINYCIKHRLCDYLTYSSGDTGAIREVSEVVLDGIGKFDSTIDERIDFHGIYADFLKDKTTIETQFMQSDQAGGFVKKDFSAIV
ncbi:MAG: phosphatase [Cyclobacteriaceae bacterium]|nr:phosphatase [Cyclobacteriaceae bacterium]